MTRSEELLLLIVALLCMLINIHGTYVLVELWGEVEQRSIQIHMPYAPPEKDTITWAGP